MIGRYAHSDKYRQLLQMKEFYQVFLGAVLIVTSYLLGRGNYLLPSDILSLLAVLILGGPIILDAAKGLLQKQLNVDELVSLAIIASVAVGAYLSAAVVAFIMVLGALAEEFTAQKARLAIDSLTDLNPTKATVIRKGREISVPVQEIKLGERVLIRSGEKVPVDGVVIRGSASMNQASLTGESMPLEKSMGDSVYAGSVSYSGMIELETIKVGENTTLGQLIRLVQEAENQKAPILRTADNYAQYFTPIIVILALGVYLFTGDLHRAITVLIVGCPCAFILSAPTAIVSALGKASRNGILVKGGALIEELSRIDTIVFDKTGTITTGRPAVTEIQAFCGVTRAHVLTMAAAAEKYSTHPLAKAIDLAAEQLRLSIPEPDDFQDLPGLGVEVKMAGKKIYVGRAAPGKVYIDEDDEIKTKPGLKMITVHENEQEIGRIYIKDIMRPAVPQVVETLQKMGIKNIQLLTGDNHDVAANIAGQSGIENFHADLLPDQKLERVRILQKDGCKVIVVGDGINDAPSLTAADVGIAMGAMGTDVAIEAADIALMGDDLAKLPYLIGLGRATVKTININIIFAVIFNGLALLASMKGLLSPIMGAVVHNIGSVAVVINSALLTRFKMNIHKQGQETQTGIEMKLMETVMENEMIMIKGKAGIKN